MAVQAEPVMKRCALCGSMQKEEVKSCSNCGGKVFETFAVKAVSTNVPVDSTFVPETKGIDKPEPKKPGKCQNCGKPVEEEWLACPYCKAEIARERLCAHCGKKLEPDWVICPFCKAET